ncbi:MAG TPA: DNA polymerase III subunit beta [Urbifossiella sp.]|jgi:DNA polymerase-3 subunit beta|nr:DNA polymerase III subunit beta [Urbifossiella sp.]
MKITCPREGLLTACQLVSAAVAARTTKPILSNVKAVAADDGLTLVAFDTEVGIRYELRGIQVKKAGEAILAVHQLTQILRESQDSDVSIEASDDGAKVLIGTGRFEMPGYPVNEFPDLPPFEDGGRYHEITAGDLRKMIRRTSFAADKKDSTRFALSGVLWEAEGKQARLVATDSKRLAVCEGNATLHGPAEATKGSHLVPAKTMTLLDRNLTDDGELVRVALRPNEAMFQTERAMIYTRLVEGRYPPYRDIIAQTRKQSNRKIALPVESFLSRIRQAAIMSDDESKRVDLTFSPGKITMKARGAETGSSEVVMTLPEYDGEEVTIAFDPQYVVEFLRALEGEPSVMLEMSDGSKPALFQCGETYRYLVMPISG